MNTIIANRRSFFGTSGALSAVAVAMLAGNEAMAQGMGADTSKDTGILNVALGLEHEAINAYQLGAMRGLCARGGFVLDLEWKDGKLTAVGIQSSRACTMV